jgi:parvulin-like peptidyl-prolyl isomerase
MRHVIVIFVWIVTAATSVGARPILPAQESSRVVDRIVARIEGDIVLQSQLRELGAFQQLVEGHAESDDRLLAELIEQWIVETEATDARFPQPAQSEVDREMARLLSQLGSSEAYAAKLKDQGLSAAQVRQLLTRQIFVERYMDYKFRPTVQIESADVENYYRSDFVPEFAKKNKSAPAPPLSEVEGQIRELLTQREMSTMAAKWLDDTKSRLKIEIASPGAKP